MTRSIAAPSSVHEDGYGLQPHTLSHIPPAEPVPKLIELRNYAVLAVVFAYLLFNWGTQQLRIPPVSGGGLPLAELCVVLFFLTIDPVRTAFRLSRAVLFFPLLIWWGLGIGRSLYDATNSGPWAIRDASHVIESLFIVLGFVVAARPAMLRRILDLVPYALVIICAYGLFYPIKDTLAALSPTITSFNGLNVPVFGFMANTQYVMIATGYYLLVKHGRDYLWTLLAGFLIVFPILLFQQRTLYLIVIALSATIIVFRRSRVWNLSLFVILAVIVLALVFLTGLRVEGRLGEEIGPEFIWHHFFAIFGICDSSITVICAAASGVDLRLGWWETIFEQLWSSPEKLLFGLGYGVILTDHAGDTGVATREPHNSYISVVARMGLVGLLAYVAMIASLIVQWLRAYRLSVQLGWEQGQEILLLFLFYFICMWVLGIGEDGFEKPYNAVPFYFLWGIVLRLGMSLRENVIGPPVTHGPARASL